MFPSKVTRVPDMTKECGVKGLINLVTGAGLIRLYPPLYANTLSLYKVPRLPELPI